MSRLTLQKLLARLRALTHPQKQRGQRAALARHLGVSPSLVTEWLSGKFEPGGDITLQLLEWVAAEEAKQNKMPAQVLDTPTRAAAQPRKTRESKPKPSRQKK